MTRRAIQELKSESGEEDEAGMLGRVEDKEDWEMWWPGVLFWQGSATALVVFVRLLNWCEVLVAGFVAAVVQFR